LFVVYTLYVVAAVLLAIYGLNAMVLTFLFLKARQAEPSLPDVDEWPLVTVQVPTFNERYVVERVIDAVAQLDYPRERLQIQILDDSTDETTARAAARVAWHRSRGIDIVLSHRRERVGFKAGALQEGLARARGEIIVLFDADFVPGRDFLRRTVPFFVANPKLGMVQTRWGHLNADYSLLTRVQSLALDGHFVVEQAARQRSGLFMNFNGTAGLWRRGCIEDVGGWRHDTICEDLDLSYRAQLAGWEFLYLPTIEAPAEIPAQITAFKRQQFRWAKGSIQCARMLGGAVIRSSGSWFRRLEGIIHLTSYVVHPLMLLLLLVSVPLMRWEIPIHLPLAYLSLASLGPPILYLVSQRSLYPNWRSRSLLVFGLMFLGTGVAMSNTVAVYEAIAHRPNRFRRTPKFGLKSRHDRWSGKEYVLSALTPLAVAELGLSAYAALGILVAFRHDNPFAAPFLLLYAVGFGYVGLMTIMHGLPAEGWRALGGPGTARGRRVGSLVGRGDG
jgi:cellulose synthase/poly-beta-1,6-N-acetylglucosamine synthase-like glycosyltransferase